jgi:hypothetical protein
MDPWHAPQRHATVKSVMPSSSDIPLCVYVDSAGRHELSAAVDELTLTYDVVDSGPDRRRRVLSRHFASLRSARAWATAYRDAIQPRLRCGS